MLFYSVVGDDGIEGIALGGNYEGQAYKKFQQTIKQLKKQGVLLAINSKNEFSNISEIFSQHPEMCLALEDFVSIQANWMPKIENMKTIGDSLNIGLDSCVFVDDSQAECALIKKYMPEIEVINLSEDPSFYVNELLNNGFFNKLEMTEEDLLRTDSYQAETKRKVLLKSYENIEDYLHDLNITLRIFTPTLMDVSRISQLALRTNQFNLTGIRYSQQEIEKLLVDNNWLVCCGLIKTDTKVKSFGKL